MLRSNWKLLFEVNFSKNKLFTLDFLEVVAASSLVPMELA